MKRLLPGESISSWILRVRASYPEEINNLKGLDILLKERFDEIKINQSSECEFDAKVLRSHVQVPDQSAEGLAKDFWLIKPVYKRLTFCPMCVQEDLRDYLTCYWRSTWEHGWCVICDLHHVRLVELPDIMYGFNTISRRFGDAFAFSVTAPLEAYCDSYSLSPSSVVLLDKGRFTLDRPNHAARVRQALCGLAYILQTFISDVLVREGVEDDRLVLIHDFLRLAMRPVSARCMVEPLAFTINRTMGFKRYGSARSLLPSTEKMLFQTDSYYTIWIRIIAMAIVAYAIQLQGSQSWWNYLTASCRHCGLSIPLTPEQVRENLITGSYWDTRNWFARRHGEFNDWTRVFTPHRT